MRWFLAVVALASACGGDGVEIHVDVGSTGATSVELFLTTGDCPNCAPVGPPGEQAPLTPSTVYVRDAAGRYRAEVGGDGVARFWLREGPGGSAVPFAIAVGVTGDRERTEVGVQALSIDASGGRVIYKTTLEPAKPRLERPSDATGRFVQVWHASDEEACVIVEDAKPNESTYVAIVPDGDRDCDGIIAGECSPNVYKYVAPPSGDIKQSTCSVRAPTATGMACRLGGGCADGGAQCAPSHACVPDALCDCALDDLACLVQQASAPSFRVECNVPTNNGLLCQSLSDTLEVHVPTFQQTMTTCENVRFVPLPKANQPIVQPLLDPQSSLSFPDGARVDFLDDSGVGCLMNLKVSSPPTPPSMVASRERALMLLDASNGYTVVVPLVINFIPDACGTSKTVCQFIGADATNVNGDSMWNCLRVPPM